MKTFFLFSLLVLQALSQEIPSCDSKVFCQGDLLHTVQMAKVFIDSKTFVDMKMKNPENVTLANFDDFVKANPNATSDDIEKFVYDNFEDGDELGDWTPEDYNESPELLSRINDPEAKDFAQNLIKIWPQLAKKIRPEVLEHSELYSLIPVENGFIIPGGRFKEFYYWDSYWIIRGLLLSDMHGTVKGMLDNFLTMVDQNGFVPNGARIYYLNRSQPPLLTLMVNTYIDATNDVEWLKPKIPLLDKELRYWLDNKLIQITKNGRNYTLAHYNSQSGSPRPESYYEDITTANYFTNDEDKINLWKDLKSGAETGWDFSSRWIVDENGGNQANLTWIQTRRIVPVDLNAILCQAFRILAEFYANHLNDLQNARFWFEQANRWALNIERVFYDDETGIWYDYDAELQQNRLLFYASNFAPLWAGSYLPSNINHGQRAAKYFKQLKLDYYQGGIPTSQDESGEQWDFPNAWPPLQSIVVLGLEKTGDDDAVALAKDLAQKWIKANIIGYNETHQMFEKYDATQPGKYGGGGEYTVQSGFGWTNGVALEFLDKFYADSN